VHSSDSADQRGRHATRFTAPADVSADRIRAGLRRGRRALVPRQPGAGAGPVELSFGRAGVRALRRAADHADRPAGPRAGGRRGRGPRDGGTVAERAGPLDREVPWGHSQRAVGSELRGGTARDVVPRRPPTVRCWNRWRTPIALSSRTTCSASSRRRPAP
jgi:hypothetical protein